MQVVSATDMLRLEQSSGLGTAELIERAGVAVGEAIIELFDLPESVCVLAGSGNNGADGVSAAKYLAEHGSQVELVLIGRQADQLVRDACQVGVRKIKCDAKTVARSCAKADLTVDAVLGTGKNRPLNAATGAILKAASKSDAIFAVDLPSGLNCDTGEWDANGLTATTTIALGMPKYGHFFLQGPLHSGELYVADIGIKPDVYDSKLTMLDETIAQKLLPPRPRSAHKGDFGRLLIVAGSNNYLGAAELASRAALRSGVGVVELVLPSTLVGRLRNLPAEAIVHPVDGADDGVFTPEALPAVVRLADKATAVLVGPGLGLELSTQQSVALLLSNLPPHLPMVVDADGLNALSVSTEWRKLSARRLILTPHFKELARLMGVDAQQVVDERLGMVLKATALFDACVVLKGAATLVAVPQSATYVSPWSNSVLAKAGSGDVLAGLCGGLLAQSPWADGGMAALAVYVHGLAGLLAAERHGVRSATPSDTIECFGEAFLELENGR